MIPLRAQADCSAPDKLQPLDELLKTQKASQDLVCRLDLEFCEGRYESAQKLIDHQTSPFEFCKARSSYPARSALKNKDLPAPVAKKIFENFSSIKLSDPDLVSSEDGIPKSLLQTAIESRNLPAIQAILSRKDIHPNRELSYETGAGTPPTTAWALLRENLVSASEGPPPELLQIQQLLSKAGATFENCLGVVTLNDTDVKGTNLRSSPDSHARVLQVLPHNLSTQLLIVGHQNGWLKAGGVYPNGGGGINGGAEFQTFNPPLWIFASLTRYPDSLLKGRAEPGLYRVKSCVTENFEVENAERRLWLSTSNIAAFLP